MTRVCSTLIDHLESSPTFPFSDDFGMTVAQFDLPDEAANRVELARYRRRPPAAGTSPAWRDVFAAAKLDGRRGRIEIQVDVGSLAAELARSKSRAR